MPLMVTSAASEAVRDPRSPPDSAVLWVAVGMLFPVGMCPAGLCQHEALPGLTPCATPLCQLPVPHGAEGDEILSLDLFTSAGFS